MVVEGHTATFVYELGFWPKKFKILQLRLQKPCIKAQSGHKTR
jgi:hypothetical protein